MAEALDSDPQFYSRSLQFTVHHSRVLLVTQNTSEQIAASPVVFIVRNRSTVVLLYFSDHIHNTCAVLVSIENYFSSPL